MNDSPAPVFTAFLGSKRLSSGTLSEVALAAKKAIDRGAQHPLLIFNDRSGRAIDIDTRGNDAEVLARLTNPAPATAPRRRGRPKLGVISREVTLLPRHWQWLGSQPGGASVALRELVDAARRSSQESDQRRERLDAAYHFVLSFGGNLLNIDAASQALLASERERFVDLAASWPGDIREHAVKLAFAGADGAQWSL